MTIADVITGVWTTERVRYYSQKSKGGKVHIVHVSGTENFRSIFTTLCGKTFNDRYMKWRRSFDPVTCSKCQKVFEKIEPLVLDIVNFEIDLDAFGAVGPIPKVVVPRTCITCGKLCPYWKEVRKNEAPWCTIWYANNRVEKLWGLKITTNHMRQLTCERLQKIYEYIRLGNPIGVQKQARFLSRLLTVMDEKSCRIPGGQDVD